MRYVATSLNLLLPCGGLNLARCFGHPSATRIELYIIFCRIMLLYPSHNRVGFLTECARFLSARYIKYQVRTIVSHKRASIVVPSYRTPSTLPDPRYPIEDPSSHAPVGNLLNFVYLYPRSVPLCYTACLLSHPILALLHPWKLVTQKWSIGLIDQFSSPPRRPFVQNINILFAAGVWYGRNARHGNQGPAAAPRTGQTKGLRVPCIHNRSKQWNKLGASNTECALLGKNLAANSSGYRELYDVRYISGLCGRACRACHMDDGLQRLVSH